MTLTEKKDALVEDLSIIEDPQERFAYIIENARSQPALTAEFKVEAFRIKGCQSQLWLVPRLENGLCYFETDSDAVITKGIAGLLTQLYSGFPPEEIIETPPNFLAEVGITQHLTPNRRNGLSNVWNTIKSFAEHCLNQVQRP
ncbi:SufE family protein [Cerasicoccus arenae]|uniref:Fe-S metabolism protein SufE n=1 Tax=Cerasicoccus arenae TaxID=424488 RepID=A0A8J3DDW6_9BACT|nr:SufE family protein [Cerasicoccus arenae]MBK1860055.1 SufE family protein [Cerasicoccus arenae]GHC08446.1 Fe-S metabolism protein SufE [Cerasicoccus arenae]